MNDIVKNESEVSLFGLTARAHNVVANTETGRILNQQINTVKYYKKSGQEYRITAKLRLDDECKNGNETFSIIGDIDEKTKNGGWRNYSGGRIHNEIAKHFPQLAHLIKWHLTSTGGPMHYIANTTYHASNRDYDGLLAGEPNLNPVHMAHGVKFDNVPIIHNLKRDFAEFIKSRIGTDDFTVISIAHVNKLGDNYDFKPKWTFNGFGLTWYDCPFDNQDKAQIFADALNKCKAKFVSYPTVFGKGKERDFEAARMCAMWPDATDDQLILDKKELTALLMARHEKLIADFKSDMLAAGFLWPDVKGAK